jgi:hypothetical protein
VQAKEKFAREQPPEVRVLKHILTIESPQDREVALAEAFTPGPQIETGDSDYVFTCASCYLLLLAL